jgi:hypothetical protein
MTDVIIRLLELSPNRTVVGVNKKQNDHTVQHIPQQRESTGFIRIVSRLFRRRREEMRDGWETLEGEHMSQTSLTTLRAAAGARDPYVYTAYSPLIF